ncbi:MAG: transpeptidase family protein [Dysgonamonadaceae bacterium]|jgi:cell division protein FtsI (penicillin-binding protein 3)|nr:transpeptidase family protein [Dysgonamonadaceae bacterium]
MNRKDNNDKAQIRYIKIIVTLSVIMFLILVRAFYIGTIERDEWLGIDRKYAPKQVESEPIRGDIYSDNMELMATTDKYYFLRIDAWAKGIKPEVLAENLDALAKELNIMLPHRSVEQYKNIITDAYFTQKQKGKPNKYYPFKIEPLNYLQLQKIKKMPWFNLKNNQNGLITETKTRTKRAKLYGSLAKRTIGEIYEGDTLRGQGRSGLEEGYDSILKGVPGIDLEMRREANKVYKPIKATVNGNDIVSTININMQDITERALLEKLQTLDAESGTAVIMDVKTGEVKAIANLGRKADGTYDEIRNYALSDLSSPGSTFKVVSMMIMLDDGVVKPDDIVDTEKGKFKIPKTNNWIEDAVKGKGILTAAQCIKYSSNIGVSKLVAKAYIKQPQKYIDLIHKIGLNKDMKLEIPGYAVARIITPTDTGRYWSNSDLYTMAYGYVNGIPPIYTLTFYNAIANNGKMLKPRFVKAILENGKTKEKKKPEIINENICKPETLQAIRQMLDSVVNAPDGTGKPVRSDIVRIAGKTGTAQLHDGKGGHQASFCGYFPSQDPKYSCIVVIRRPRNGNASGGYMSGTVFKRIAEEVSNLSANNIQPITEANDSINPKNPTVKSGYYDNIKYAMKKLDVDYTGTSTNKWITTQKNPEDGKTKITERQIPPNTVPNVIGMGAKDAVFVLEKAGLRVHIDGHGTVNSQSPTPGTKISQNQTAVIHLQ